MAPWVLEILDKRPEIALFAMFIALIAILLVVAILGALITPRSRFSDYEATLKRVLGDPDVAKSCKENPQAIENIIRGVLAAVPEPSPSLQKRGMLAKISEDITWDIAGLIGLGVTAVILIMLVAGKKTDIPDAVITGWATILGYYFGRATGGKH